jgi:hypothetical protein
MIRRLVARDSLAALFATLVAIAGREASAASTATADERDVLATVQRLLDGWREADAAKLEQSLHKDFREVTLHLADGAWNFAAVDRARLVGLMAQIPRGSWDDRLVAPQVHVDGPIAVVWSRYRFTVNFTENGVEHHPVHCGIETFQLYRVDGAWKIVNFADTHSDTCS